MNVTGWLRLARQQPRDGPVLITFATNALLDLLLNWLVSVDSLGIHNYLIVSLDRRLYEYLSKRQIPTVFSEWSGGLERLWKKRVHVWLAFTRGKLNYIHCDLDAVWVRNPTPRYFMTPEYDLLISQDTTWPPSIIARRGFILCCGLFHARSCESTEQLFEDVVGDIKETGDDQWSLNRVIERYNIEWQTDHQRTYRLKHVGHQFLCSERIIRGEHSDTGLTVGVLPHHEFQRLHMPERNAYVKHLVRSGLPGDKADILRANNLWLLDPEWRSIDFDVASLQNIRGPAG